MEYHQQNQIAAAVLLVQYTWIDFRSHHLASSFFCQDLEKLVHPEFSTVGGSIL